MYQKIKFTFGLSLLLSIFLAPVSSRGAGVELIRDGKVVARIVIADNPTTLESHAGELICKYLARMAGSSKIPQPVKKSDHTFAPESSVILVGRSESNMKIQQLMEKGKLQLSAAQPGGDGIVIKTILDNNIHYLILGGSSNRSVLHAVVHFLENYAKIGIFWDGEYIPSRKNWQVENISISEKPHFPIRQYGQGCAFSYSYMEWWNLEERKRHLDWAAFKKQSRIMWPFAGNVDSNTNAKDKFIRKIALESGDYGRESLGIEFFSDKDKLYNRDPFPEVRVSEDPKEEDRIIKEWVEETLATNDPEFTWYASGWAVFNPGWRQETAKKFFTAIGDAKFYICDIWAEVHPIYKKYNYFYGCDWGFGVLHSFGGSTTLHGDMAGLIRKVKDVVKDPKADRCIAFYINPEVIIYNDFYFDLTTQLSWRPQDVELDSFIADYAERRYGSASKAKMTVAYKELAASVYSTDDRSGPFWQGRIGNTFSSVGTTRLTYIPNLDKAIENMLAEEKNQHGNKLYGKDLIDITKQFIGEIANGHLFRHYNAFAWKNEKAFKESAAALRLCLDQVEKLLTSRKEYWLQPILEQIDQYPGMNKEKRKEAEVFFKDTVMSFALRENLRDYNHRDIKELFDYYYRPRAEAYISYLEKKFTAGDHTFDGADLVDAYSTIEKNWIENPIPRIKIKFETGKDIAAVKEAFKAMRGITGMIRFDSSGQIRNGGFEEGRPEGWRISNQNMDVNISSEFKTFTGFGSENLYALHFVGDKQRRYKTFTAEQKVNWTEKTKISLDYKIDACSPHANTYLRISRDSSDGKPGVQVLYFWGGDSWDLKTSTPEENGRTYSMADQLKAPRGEWQKLDRVPSEDFDAVHGKGKWKSLGVDAVTVVIGSWVREEHDNHIEGWVDELKITNPSK